MTQTTHAETKPGLRERKRAETRRALRAQATRLVEERGLTHVTVDEIADAAGVSPRTFFNYFPTKEHAVVGVDPERWQAAQAHLRTLPPGVTTLDALRTVLISMIDDRDIDTGLDAHRAYSGEYAADWATRARLIRAEPTLLAASSAAWQTAEADMIAAVAERLGLDAEHPYPALVVGVAFTATRSAFLRWRSTRRTPSPAGLIGEAFDTLAAGLPDPHHATTNTSSKDRP